MNYYQLIKLNNFISNPRLKFFGVLLLHIFKKRYISVHFDPVNACNLRCKMCYFTDEDYVKKLKGLFDPNDLPLLSEAILKRAIKLQVGCGTEPTLYKHLDEVFRIASLAGVPYISMTTNANLLDQEKLEKWSKLGLKEITCSLHGVHKTTYEKFMHNGDYNLFMASIRLITETKEKFPSLKLRINYTFNEDNFDELESFWSVFAKAKIDTLQLRPIQNIGNTQYNNFSMERIIPKYADLHSRLGKECKRRNVLFIAPDQDQLNERMSLNSVIKNFTYCYISPHFFWRRGFDWKRETFDQYSSRTGWISGLVKRIFSPNSKFDKFMNTSLNYNLS